MYHFLNTKEPRFIGMDFTFRNEGDAAIIDIDGKIGQDLLKELFTDEKSENTGKEIKKKIRGITAPKIIVNLNSPGGDVNDGLYIHDLLAEHPAQVETVMRGLNASASTMIGQAGDVRWMSDNGMYLVHAPIVGFCGMLNKFDLDLLKEDVLKVESRIINLYQKRSKKTKDFKGLMEKARGRGVWLEPKDALDYGFIDEIYEPTDEEKQVQNIDSSVFYALGIPMPKDIKSELKYKIVLDTTDLPVTVAALINAAENDGCEYDENNNLIGCRKKELHNEDASAISRKQMIKNNINKQLSEVH